MKITIGPMDLVDTDMEQKGFMRLNTGRTLTWTKLEKVGLGLIPKDKRPYTGKIPLYINDGGIDHDDLQKHYKKVFKEDVLPAIKRIAPDIKRFWLILNFNIDKLEKAMLDSD